MPGGQQGTAAPLQHIIQVLQAVETEDAIQLRPTPAQVVVGIQILAGQVLKEGEGDLFRIHRRSLEIGVCFFWRRVWVAIFCITGDEKGSTRDVGALQSEVKEKVG